MKILILDIETAPMMAFVWGLWQQNVGLNQLIENSYILSYAAKWHNNSKMFYADNRKARGLKGLENDRQLVIGLAELINEADMIVAHNGKNFDMRVIQARMMAYDMDPPSSYRIIDTKLIAKKHFRLPSYKLEYLADHFNVKYKKQKHDKFSGFDLWREIVMNQNQLAWKEMEKYNKYDVLSLEELYFEKFSKWDNNANFFAYQDECICGSRRFKKRGYAVLNTGTFQRYRCLVCGREFRSTRSLKRAQFVPTQRNN